MTVRIIQYQAPLSSDNYYISYKAYDHNIHEQYATRELLSQLPTVHSVSGQILLAPRSGVVFICNEVL